MGLEARLTIIKGHIIMGLVILPRPIYKSWRKLVSLSSEFRGALPPNYTSAGMWLALASSRIIAVQGFSCPHFKFSSQNQCTYI